MTRNRGADDRGGRAEAWLHRMLSETVEQGASDLFLKSGSPPALRIDGTVTFTEQETVTDAAMERVAELLLPDRMDEFRETGEVDLAHEVEDVGRFRVNVFRQRGRISAAFRHIPREVPGFEELGLPGEQMRHLASRGRGLVLVTGITGSGKSTTLAAMVDYMNDNFGRHVITIEDPIEFTHPDRTCMVEQREVGADTTSFPRALKHVVRQSPDVILIGEMRDRETIDTALNAAEIGHLVLSTLHTASAMQTLERIVSYFPPHQHELVRMQLANTMQGIISQQLLTRADGRGRVPAVEVMMRAPTVCEHIQEGRTEDLPRAMEEDTYYGSCTYPQALEKLYREGTVTLEEALSAASRPRELKNKIQGLEMGRGSR